MLALVCFVTFTFGYRTKLFHALSLLFITSLNARNLFVENGGTIVVNILGLWTLFLPLGRRFSIDALLASMRARSEGSSAELDDRTRPSIPNVPHVSLVVLALLLQWSVIYFFNFVHKSGVGWRNNTAIYWFLEQNRIVTWFGVWARNHLPLVIIKVMTRGAVMTEATLSFVMLIPVGRENMRRIGLFLAIGLHGAIAAMSRLGPFSYVMVIQFVIHLSAADFEYVSRWFARPSRARTVIYDADCGICLWLCRLLKRLDPFERLTFVGNDERDKIPSHFDDALLDRTLLVLMPDGRAVREERAVFEVARAIPFGIVPFFWLAVPGLSRLGNALYRRIAPNRARISAWFGLAQCGVPLATASPGAELAVPDKTWRSDWASALVVPREALIALLMIVLGTEVCVDNPWMVKRVHVTRPEWMQTIVETPRIFQGWGMFAPEPPYDDGHLVVDGRTEDGRKLDPFTGREPVLDPYSATGWGDDQLWCDYTNHIRWSNNAPNRVHLREYLEHFQEYAGRPQDKLAGFDVWWVQNKSPQPGQSHGEPLPPEKLISFGTVRDSLATPWLAKDAPAPTVAPARRTHG
ncbi:MAG TPA: DCC1-like thiol-disulfide oxidoreductase family protein [Polyangiaceae bacterium]|nr:DCC1-like thiol-disulfide oxidoreductase family protein [Polyangiaceae bacterium]